jgi:hypothetical protein
MGAVAVGCKAAFIKVNNIPATVVAHPLTQLM